MERDGHSQVIWSSSWYQIFRALITKFTVADQDKTRCRHQCSVHNLVDRGGTVEVQFSNEEGKIDTAEAELVICADGISSTTKQLFVPECKSTYAGYTILRGLILESQLSPEVQAVFDDSAFVAYNHNSQMLSYWVPSNEGQFSRDKRYFNWGWYSTYSEEELDDIMTDSSGTRHRFTMPQGSLREEVADQIRARAREAALS
jgi:2,6-dihydroxypyridine 3-monooxygenase